MCCRVVVRFGEVDGGEARDDESGVGSGVYDVVVPILWTLSCPSTDVTVHGPTAL